MSDNVHEVESKGIESDQETYNETCCHPYMSEGGTLGRWREIIRFPLSLSLGLLRSRGPRFGFDRHRSVMTDKTGTIISKTSEKAAYNKHTSDHDNPRGLDAVGISGL
jgi:hypothetical protein